MSIRPLWFVHLYPVEEKLYYPEVISNLYYLLRAFFFLIFVLESLTLLQLMFVCV